MHIQGTFLGGDAPVDIEVSDGVVQSVGPTSHAAPECGSRDSIIAPMLFDIQVNGAFGIELLDSKTTPDDVMRLRDLLAVRGGVAYWIPTLITASYESLERGCRLLAGMLQDRALSRTIPGIHLEGPYISPEDGPRGAHPRRHVRPPDLEEFKRLQDAADGAIRYVTIAPESEGAEIFVREVSKQGVVVALGHHQASPDAISRAADAGARLCTHLGNGMASQIHRHHNPLWPQLADDRLHAAFIADCVHLPPAVLKTFIRAKGIDRTILTSDVTHPAGLPPGRYVVGEADVEVTPSGRICLTGTDLLAGSGLMLLQGLVNAVHHTDLTLEQAFVCARDIPARLFGVDASWNPPAQGEKADFVVFHTTPVPDGAPQAVVDGVWLDGQWIAPNN